MDWRTSSSNSMGPGMRRVGCSGCEDMLRCDDDESRRVCIERVLAEMDITEGGPPERCCEIRDNRVEGLDDDRWSDNGGEEEGLPARWGNAVLEATLRILACVDDPRA